MKKTLLALLMLTGIGVQAQDAVISGHLLKKKNSANAPRLVNEQLAVDMPVILTEDQSFKITVPKVVKGFYQLGTAGTIYLEPGYKLKLEAQADSSYTFSGKGSEENAILAKVNGPDKKVLPLSNTQMTFTWKALSDPIDTLLNNIQQYRALTAKTLSASKNTEFRKLAEAQVNYFTLNLLPPFKNVYGLDRERYKAYQQMLKTRDPNDTFYEKRVQRAGALSMKKILRGFERVRIDSMYTSNFDWNNEAVFNNSSEYRKTLIGQAELLASNKASDKDGIKLAAIEEAKKNISAPKIRAFVVASSAMDFMRLSKVSARIDSVYQLAIAEQLSANDRKKLDELYANSKTIK